ncbi:MAG: SDR family oxidoreductase [Thiobacillaceae bacterium]
MNILLCGADGFVGGALAVELMRGGHRVTRGVHTPRHPGDLAMDYRADTTVAAWLPRLANIDAVINAVGILREQQPDDFDRIHHRTPAALFEACQQAAVRRVVQISALGTASTPYLSSKRAADAVLRKTRAAGVVLRPGLIYGPNGASTRFFLTLASLPLQAHPRGAGEVQPVHVDDVVEAVVRLIEGAPCGGGLLELPGPRRLSYADWLATYRAGLGLAPARVVSIPAPLMALGARISGLIPNSLLSATTWAMLRSGNTGDPTAALALLHRPLTAPEQFIRPNDAELLRLRAFACWRKPLLRAVLAIIWLATAVFSAALFPVNDSLALLAPFGITGAPALLVLFGLTALDLLMGLLTVLRPRRRLWLTQLALVGCYSLLVAWRLPMFTIHPFGPILKNLAVAALLVQLLAEEDAP